MQGFEHPYLLRLLDLFEEVESDELLYRPKGPEQGWGLPLTFIKDQLAVKEPEQLIVFEVRDDTMKPTISRGDRLLIDRSDRVPSPPGMFLVWDGLGPVVKTVEPVHSSMPKRYRIGSNDPRFETVEVGADDSLLIGRVVWLGRRP